jgi:hypothetical protein
MDCDIFIFWVFGVMKMMQGVTLETICRCLGCGGRAGSAHSAPLCRAWHDCQLVVSERPRGQSQASGRVDSIIHHISHITTCRLVTA